MLKKLSQLRQFWLIALMVLTLGGVQIIQASPLHDHTRDSVDCALCHLPLGDDPGAHSSPVPIFAPQFSAVFFQTILSSTVHNPSPYQGRAPPLFIL